MSGVNRLPGNQIRSLASCVAIGRPGLGFHLDVYREARPGGKHARQFPSTDYLIGQTAMIQIPGAFSEGKLVNRVRDHRVPNVETRVATVAGAAGLILIAETLTRSA